MLYRLPILYWSDFWDEIGRRFPSVAGAAYIKWMTHDYPPKYCLKVAILERHVTDRHWKKRHRRLPRILVARPETHVYDHADRLRRELSAIEHDFAGDSTLLHIVRCLSRGMSATEAGRLIGLSRSAVDSHLRKLRR